MHTPNLRSCQPGPGARIRPAWLALTALLICSPLALGPAAPAPAAAQDAVPADSLQGEGDGSEASSGAAADAVPAGSAAAPAARSEAEPPAMAPVPEARFEPGADVESPAVGVFRSIEMAWRLAQPESLLRHFGEGKVALAFSRGGPRGGIFTRTQASYLLSDLFKYSTIEKFQFVKYRNIGENGQAPFAVADRVFRLDSGILYHDQVYVSLRREGEGWKVAEIKSIDR
jgi:hypothetical protein